MSINALQDDKFLTHFLKSNKKHQTNQGEVYHETHEETNDGVRKDFHKVTYEELVKIYYEEFKRQ